MIGKHATTVATEHDEFGSVTRVTYHNTVVFQIERRPDALYVTLDTGGWSTVTTKQRMNQALEEFGIPARVHQTNFDWRIWLLEDGAMSDEWIDYPGRRITLRVNFPRTSVRLAA